MMTTVAALLCMLLLAAGSSAQVAVIANKSVPWDTLKKSQLLDFYTGDVKSWGNDVRVVVFDLKPKGEVRDAFYEFLGKPSSRMKSIWMKKMLSGEGEPPEALKTEEEMLQKVASTPGAIGFISRAKTNDEVKTLLIINAEKE